MDSDPYMNQRHAGGSLGQGGLQHQQQQQSTLNSLLSAPSSFAPSMNQMYPSHPMQQQHQQQQQQGFDGQGGGYPGMQYGQPMQGMHGGMQQPHRGSFGQMGGPPIGRMAPGGVPPMMQSSDKGQSDWMAYQQQQQLQPQQQPMHHHQGGPYSQMMHHPQQQQQQPPGGMMGGQQQFPGGPPPPDMNQMEEDTPPPKSKSKKKKRNPSPAAGSPTPPSARSSAHQIQQQVLQQQMVPPPPIMEPDPPKKPSKKKKKKTEPPAPAPDIPGPGPSSAAGMDRPGQGMEPPDRGFPPPSFFQQQQQQQQQQQMQYQPQHQQQHQQRPPFPHGPSQFPPQPQHGGQPGWGDRGPMPSWMQQPPPMQQSGPSSHNMGMPGGMGGGMPPALGQGVPPGGPSQMEIGQPHSIMTEPVSHTPSPSHSSSSSQNVYNQSREFPFSADVPPTPPAKPKKAPTKSHKAGAAAAERAARELREETGEDLPWAPATPVPVASSHSGSGKSATEKLSLLYEMGNEPDRRITVDGIIKCSEENGVPILNIPVIAKVSLDLYKFYHIVRSRGGYIEVHRTKGWKDIAATMGIISPNPNTAYTLKKQYIKFVLPYEARYDRGGQTPEQIIETADAIPSKSPSRPRPSGGGGGGGGGDSKKRSRTSVSAVEQLSNSADGPDGMGGPYQPGGGGPPPNPNFVGRGGMQQFPDGQQYPPPQSYPPQSAPSPGYVNTIPPEMGGQQGAPYWPGGPGQMGGPAGPPAIPFDGRGLQGEVFPSDAGRGDDSMQQRGGPPMHAGGRPQPPINAYGLHSGMDRQPSGMTGDGGQGGLNGQTGFMTAPPPTQMSQQPFPDRHSAIPVPQHMHGQTQIPGGPPMSNGPPRMHPGKDGRMMSGPMGGDPQQHHRQHRASAMQMQMMQQNVPPPVETFNFPPGCVESTEIVLRNRPRMTARDAATGATPPVDVWKLHMRMRSGLMAESGWAFEMLNIYTCDRDDQLCGQFSLANLPAGFLETVIDWFQVAMHRLTDSKKELVPAVPSAVTPDDGDAPASEIVDDWDTAYAENVHLRTNLDYPPWGACEGRERLQEVVPASIDPDNNGQAPAPVVELDGQGNPLLPKQQSAAEPPPPPKSAMPFFLNLTSETEGDIGRKCVAISTSLRNLSAIHGNEVVMAKNQRLLSLIGRFITFSHFHLTEEVFGPKAAAVVEDVAAPNADADMSSASLFSVSFTESDIVSSATDTLVGDLSDVEETNTAPAAAPIPWWQDVMEHVRENLLVALANMSGYMDLAECHETVCRPILEGLIHWTTCPSSMAQDVLPTAVSQHPSGELSAKCLALEAISKLSVTDANIDLLIAAPSSAQLAHFIHELIQLLPSSSPWTATAHLLREFAMVVLCSLVTCEERVCHIVAEHPFGLEYLTMLLEEFDRMAQHGLKFDGHEGPMPTPNSAFSAMMLRKTIEILLTMAELPAVRNILAKYQLRFWNLIVAYHFPDGMALTGLTKILYLLSAAEGTTSA
ncbi:putative Trithorax group protein osa [Hypsibius exemplaris]|uniref:Trithorax group protein osa n=1 Tax=Hypsibius exemplaris TaxID=2072580 RepID=A0A1W0WL56_HYPEX|nr:putative Trithorax group protein osa [Hypsibius exemplaris]